MPQAVDPFRITNKLEPGTLDVIVARLETRGHHPHFAKPLSDYLDRMNIDSAAKVLDLGCGTGIAARAIAQRPGFKGSILGIDLSDHLIQAARRFAAEERLSDRVRFETGDFAYTRACARLVRRRRGSYAFQSSRRPRSSAHRDASCTSVGGNSLASSTVTTRQ